MHETILIIHYFQTKIVNRIINDLISYVYTVYYNCGHLRRGGRLRLEKEHVMNLMNLNNKIFAISSDSNSSSSSTSRIIFITE